MRLSYGMIEVMWPRDKQCSSAFFTAMISFIPYKKKKRPFSSAFFKP